MACCLTKPFSEQCWLNNGVLWHLLQKKSQEVFNKWTSKMSLKQSLIKLLPHLLGPTNQLTLMLLIVASGVWYILIPRHFDSSMPVTKLINRVSDQHQPVTSCWALWRGMIWYHVMAVSGLVRTHDWCSINTWPRKNGRQFANDYSILFSSIKIGTSCLKFHRDLLPGAQLTLSQFWYKLWLGVEQATNHYLNHYWPSKLGICASLDFDQLTYRISIRCALFIFLVARYWPSIAIFHQVASLLLGRLLSQYLWKDPDEYGRISSCYS